MKQDYVLSLNGNWYDVIVNTASSGTVTIDKSIGSNGMSATLTPTPIQGAVLSGYDVTGGIIQGNTFIFGNSDAIIQPVFSENVAPSITAGWTTLTTGASRPSFDVAGGVSKSIHMQTTQIDGSYVSSYYAENVWSDQLPLYATGAGIWNNEWLNYYDYSQYTDMSKNFSFENVQNTVGIYTIDFFDRTNIGGGSCPLIGGLDNYIRFIPSSTTGIFHYDSLTSIDNLFNSCTAITGEIIPFITAMNALKPGISHSNCFYNCTNASDYSQAVSQYPDWVNDNNGGGNEEPSEENWCCNFCGTENSPSDEYCYNCGEYRYNSPMSYEHCCNFCGTEFDGDQCPNCGQSYWESPE